MNIRLKLLKLLTNRYVRRIAKVAPKTEPTYPVSQIIDALEEYYLRSINSHPTHFYKDGNFTNFVKTSTRLIIYLCENDSHYRAMISILFIQISALIQREQRRFDSPVEMLEWMSSQEIKYEKDRTVVT